MYYSLDEPEQAHINSTAKGQAHNRAHHVYICMHGGCDMTIMYALWRPHGNLHMLMSSDCVFYNLSNCRFTFMHVVYIVWHTLHKGNFCNIYLGEF